MIDTVKLRHCAAGEDVFKLGDPSDGLYVVHSGLIAITQEHGKRKIRRGVVGPGEAFGEIGAVDGLERTATATADTDSVLLLVTREALCAAYDDYPEGLRSAALSLAALARKMGQAEIDGLIGLRGRLARLLLANADRRGRVGIDQTDASKALRVSRSQITRLVAEFRAAGYLSPRGLTVQDREGLGREAQE